MSVRGRLSHPLRRTLDHVGLALGARAGARLADPLGLPTSPRTLLRALHALPEPEVPTPRVLGLDDFSRKRGQHFATALVDLETRRIIDLLPERSVAVVAGWLQEHPGVEIVARDRNGSYAEGIRQGVPAAIHVADRFHLMANVIDTLERVLLHHADARKAAAAALAPPALPALLPPWKQRAAEATRQKLEPRVSNYERAWAMHAQGCSNVHIARTLGLSRQAVGRYLRMDHPPQVRRHRRRRSQLDPYIPYLLHRWAEGCRNGSQLWREIRAMGDGQSRRALSYLLIEWRRQDPQALAYQPRRAKAEAWTARRVAFLCVAPPADLTDEQAAYLAALHEAQPALASAYALVQDFATMLRGRHGERLDGWITRALADEHAEVRSLAKGLQADKEAVVAGLTLPWSTGPCEGHIHKVKLIKRSMYGRAGFALLRQRVLRAA